MINKILVPYDFSNFGDAAFEKAMEIAEKFNSKLFLLTIIGSDIDTSGMTWARAQEAYDEAESNSKEKLNKIKDSNKNQNVDVSVNIYHNSSVVDGILAFAENNKMDLIVMGSHGRSGFKKFILGSVASGVLTKSTCPVLITKGKK
jgi:nucleotide-binding universal stress UspA family protein